MAQAFISYSRKDLAFVKTLAKDLEAFGLKAWYDLSDLQIGQRWAMEIQTAIQASQYFIVILSPSSIVSEWVEREFIYAEKRKLKIIPLLIEPCELPLWATSLQSVDLPGMGYGKALMELLKGMGIQAGGALKKGALDASAGPLVKPAGPKAAAAPAGLPFAWLIVLFLLAAVGLGAWAILRITGQPSASPTATRGAAAAPILASSSTLPPRSYNVQGKLFWNDVPAPGVELRMTGMAGEGFFLATSDALGIYTFEVPPGNYVLHYRFPDQVDWTASQTTPHFTPNHYAEWPIVVEAGKATSIEDIHTIREDDLQITFPDPKQDQVLSTHPTFEWAAYPSADHYQVWVYEMHLGTETAEYAVPTGAASYSIPAGAPAETRATSITLDWSIPVYSNYYVWVIAYNVNDHELADARASFAVAAP